MDPRAASNWTHPLEEASYSTFFSTGEMNSAFDQNCQHDRKWVKFRLPQYLNWQSRSFNLTNIYFIHDSESQTCVRHPLQANIMSDRAHGFGADSTGCDVGRIRHLSILSKGENHAGIHPLKTIPAIE